MSNNNQSIRDQIAQNDVSIMRSYLEVDVAEWFSDNEIPFGYEAFVIPSVVGPGKDRWDRTVEAIRNIGEGERDSVTLPDGTEMDAFEILNLWNDIYQKHRLAGEKITIDPNPALAGFSKRMLLPDFSIYEDASVKTAGDDFKWSDYDYIVEVSGLYGVGLPDEAGDSEWWDWYRVSAVAFKELAYRLLGLWDKVYWVIPNQPYIEGVTDGIPKSLRNDDHYVIMNTTQSGIDLNKLEDALGITADRSEMALSPAIQPTEYKRPLNSEEGLERNSVTPVGYTFDGVNTEEAYGHENVVPLENGYVCYHGDMGEVYVKETSVQVRKSQWKGTNMIILREYVLDALSKMATMGIIEGLEESK